MKNIFKKIIKKDRLSPIKTRKNNHNHNELSLIFNLINVWKRINKRRKSQVLILFALMVLSGFSEFLTFSSVIPFLTAITDTERLLNYQFIKILYEIFNFTNDIQIIYLTTFIFLLMVYFYLIML